jgi:hypothetical protein
MLGKKQNISLVVIATENLAETSKIIDHIYGSIVLNFKISYPVVGVAMTSTFLKASM